MGFMDHQQGKAIQVTLLTPGFQVQGTLHIMGLVQTFLNDETKMFFALNDVTMHALAAGNPATSVHVDEMYVRKTDCHAVIFPELLSREDSGLLPRSEPLAAYTSHYVIQGGFHMGADALLVDYFEVSRGILLGATDVSIFPLFQQQAALVQHAPLVYVSRKLVHTAHRA